MSPVLRIIETYKESVLFLGIFHLTVALLLLVWPSVYVRVNEKLNKWVSVEKIEETLNKRRDIDPHIFKARQIIGYMSIVLAALLLFLYFNV